MDGPPDRRTSPSTRVLLPTPPSIFRGRGPLFVDRPRDGDG